MFCSKCGKELPDGAKFCTGCGTATEETEKQREKSTESASVSGKDAGKEVKNAWRNILSFFDKNFDKIVLWSAFAAGIILLLKINLSLTAILASVSGVLMVLYVLSNVGIDSAFMAFPISAMALRSVIDIFSVTIKVYGFGSFVINIAVLCACALAWLIVYDIDVPDLSWNKHLCMYFVTAFLTVTGILKLCSALSIGSAIFYVGWTGFMMVYSLQLGKKCEAELKEIFSK